MSQASRPASAAAILATFASGPAMLPWSNCQAALRVMRLASSRCSWITLETTKAGRWETTSHAKDAVLRRRDRRAQHHGEREPEQVAGVDGIDDAVVPEARAGVVGARLLLVLGEDGCRDRGLVLGR